MWRYSAAILAACALCAPAAWAQQPGKAVTGLQLTLSAEKDELKMTPVMGPDGTVTGFTAEPTRLTLTFINTGRARLKLIAHDIDWGLTSFEVKGPDGTSVAAVRPTIERVPPEPKGKDFPEIDPSRAWSPKWQPNFPGKVGPVSFKLAKPGEYRITATYTCDESRLRVSEAAEGSWTGVVVSNVLVLKYVVPGEEPAPETKPGPETPAPAEGGGLKLELKADATEIRMTPTAGARGTVTWDVAPVKLSINLANAGEKPVKLYTHELGTRLLKLDVTGPDDKSVRALKALVRVAVPPATENDFPMLDPYSAFTLEEPIEFPGPFAGTTWSLLKPGEYRVTMTYAVTDADVKRTPLAAGCWTGTVTSNELVLKAVAVGAK